MFNEQTESAIRQRMLDKIDLDLYKGEGSDLYQLVTPLAMELASFYAWLDYFKEVIFGRKLDENFVLRAEAFGVFRKLGEKASGILTITTSDEVIIPKGTRLVKGKDLFYEVSEDLVFSEKGTKTVLCEAESVGVEYNIDENQLKFVSDMPLITSISHDKFSNGIDMETLEQLQERFFEKLRKPSSSGNIADYERWAKSIDGVVQVKVYSPEDSKGVVNIVASGEKGAKLGPEILTELENTLEELAPIGAKPDVKTTLPKKLNVEIVGFVADSSFDYEEVTKKVKETIESYFEDVEPDSMIYVNKIVGLVMGIDGVNDVSSVTINGSSSNIKLGQAEKGSLQTLTYA